MLRFLLEHQEITIFFTMFFTIFFRNDLKYDHSNKKRPKFMISGMNSRKNQDIGVPRRVCK